MNNNGSYNPDVLYLCIRNSGQALTHDLKDLIGWEKVAEMWQRTKFNTNK